MAPMLTKIIPIALRLALVLAFAWGVHLLADWAMLESTSMAADRTFNLWLLGLLLLIYALLIAIPFVPGVELGLSLLVLQGASAAPWVWLATVIGLTLAYAAGALVPPQRIAAGLRDIGLKRAGGLVDAVTPLSGADRIAMLCARLPDWIAPIALRYRYLLLAVLINVPGNALIGGGGGIGLIAGLSGIYKPGRVLATFALAVSPVPLLFWFYGTPVLSLFG